MTAATWIAIAALLTSWGQFWLKEYLEKRKALVGTKTKLTELEPRKATTLTKPRLTRAKLRFYLVHMLSMWLAFLTIVREWDGFAFAIANFRFSWSVAMVLPAMAFIGAVTWLTFGRTLEISD